MNFRLRASTRWEAPTSTCVHNRTTIARAEAVKQYAAVGNTIAAHGAGSGVVTSTLAASVKEQTACEGGGEAFCHKRTQSHKPTERNWNAVAAETTDATSTAHTAYIVDQGAIGHPSAIDARAVIPEAHTWQARASGKAQTRSR